MFVIISASWGSVFSQQLMQAPFELRNVKLAGTKIPSADNYFAFGYCADVTPVLNGGLGSSAGLTATVLIKIPAATINPYIGDSICALDMGICANINNVVAVVRNTANGANIISKSFNATLGWNRIKFDKSLKIENKDYYVGYTITLSAGQYAIGFSPTTLTKDALIIVDNSGATDYTSNYGALLVKALLLGNEAHFSNLGEIKDFTFKKYQIRNTTVDFPVKVYNKGINTITSLEITYKYASKGALTILFSNLNILSNTASTVTIPQVLLDVSGNIDFTITKINGQVLTSNTITKPVVVYNPADEVPRKVLLEQFTTEQCVYCPSGSTRIKSILNKPENINRVFWIAHHAGFYTDSYTISASSSYLRFFGSAGTYAPAMMLDRTVFDELNMGGVPVTGVGSEAEIENYVSTALSIPAFITVDISQNNPTVIADNKVNITVSGEYKGILPSGDLYVFVYLSEDGLTTTTQSGFSGVYTHNNVIRVSLGGTSGKKITWNGNKYSINFTETLNSTWKKENMNVTAFVAKNYTEAITNVNILNSERQRLSLVGNGQDKTLILSKNTLSLNSEINSSSTINIASNTAWTASSNQTWLSVSPASGTNNGTLTLKAISANTGLTARSAIVTVSGTGVASETITVTQSGTGPDLASGLVAYYPFNGDAKDESGNGNDGIVNGGFFITDRHNNVEGAYMFRGYGYGDNVRVPNSSTMRFDKELTISTWVKQETQDGMDGWGNYASGSSMTLISKDGDRGGFNWGLGNDGINKNQSLSFAINNKTDFSNQSDYANSTKNNFIYSNAWIQYAISYNSENGETKFYRNGLFQESYNDPSTTIKGINIIEANNRDMYLGIYGLAFGWAPLGWFPLNGAMDEVRIYNRALSDNEITILYNLTQTAIEYIKVIEVVKLYPNPVKKDLFIKTSSEKSTINIYSLQGSLLKTVPAYQSNNQIDVSTLQSGVYLVKISSSDGKVYAGKFVKE